MLIQSSCDKFILCLLSSPIVHIINNYTIFHFIHIYPSKHSLDEDVLKTSLVFVFRRRLQDVFIKINIFVLVIRLQDVFKTYSRRPQDIFKTSSRCFENVFKTSSRHLQDVFKTYYQVKLFLVTQF